MTLHEIDDFLRTELGANKFPASEQGGIYKPSARLIRRIGLALEPPPQVDKWVRENELDALWLHRPWQLNQALLPADVGILYHHLPFDETLTTGYNVRLAAALGFSELETLGFKTAPDPTGAHLPPRPIGMIGLVAPRSFGAWKSLVEALCGGFERAEPGRVDAPGRVAVVGAMNPSLLYEAHERGVNLYLTGEYRRGAQEAVDETGMAVIAIGHRRSEEWGLRALAALLGEKWPELEVGMG